MRKGLECPLGHECERCHWLVTLKGQNPMTGETLDQEECAIVALVLTMNQLNRNSLHIADGATGTKAILDKLINNPPRREEKRAIR